MASNWQMAFMSLPMPANSDTVLRRSAGAVLHRAIVLFVSMNTCSRHWNQDCLTVLVWRWDSTGCCWSSVEGKPCMMLSRFLSTEPSSSQGIEARQ
jgi:hypothetical protein